MEQGSYELKSCVDDDLWVARRDYLRRSMSFSRIYAVGVRPEHMKFRTLYDNYLESVEQLQKDN